MLMFRFAVCYFQQMVLPVTCLLYKSLFYISNLNPLCLLMNSESYVCKIQRCVRPILIPDFLGCLLPLLLLLSVIFGAAALVVVTVVIVVVVVVH